MYKIIIIISATLFMLAGCATTRGITPDYVSASNYSNLTCATLADEVARVSRLATQTERQQTALSTGIGIGVVGGRGGLFPTISFGVNGNNASAKERTLAKLYGEHDAMVIAARNKHCPFATNIKIYGE